MKKFIFYYPLLVIGVLMTLVIEMKSMPMYSSKSYSDSVYYGSSNIEVHQPSQ